MAWLGWALLGLNGGLALAWLGGWSVLEASQQREPQRVLTQIQPNAVRVLGTPLPAGSAPAQPGPAGAVACLQTDPLDAAGASQAGAALQSLLPDAAWTLVAQPQARWWVVLGPWSTAAERARKRAQLAALGLTVQVPTDPALAQSLAFGVYASESEAAAALREAERRGVRTARVQPGSEPPRFALRLRALDAVQQQRLRQQWPWALLACPY
ncbi:MAG: hypothetical protein Fur007_03960 [Rhodoferax sp.]